MESLILPNIPPKLTNVTLLIYLIFAFVKDFMLIFKKCFLHTNCYDD